MDFDGIPLTRMSPGLTDRLLLASPAGSLQDTSVTATAVARPDSSIFGPILQYASNYPEGAFTAIVALTALALTTPFTAMVAAAAAGAAMIFTELGIVIAANGNTVIPQWLGEPVQNYTDTTSGLAWDPNATQQSDSSVSAVSSIGLQGVSQDLYSADSANNQAIGRDVVFDQLAQNLGLNPNFGASPGGNGGTGTGGGGGTGSGGGGSGGGETQPGPVSAR